MNEGTSDCQGDGSGSDTVDPPDEPEFVDVLQSMKAKGCNLLVVGDAPRRLFTKASGGLLGGTDERRYRLLAVTDASPQSVVKRLPDPGKTLGAFDETTEVINHASPPRSVIDAGDQNDVSLLDAVSERRVVDPQLAGLQAELVESMAAFDRDADGLQPGQLRVGIDSLGSLFEHYDEGVVRRCLQVITGYARDYSAMAHYVLTEPYESDRVQRFVEEFDAVVEIRPVDSTGQDHDVEERWHVPSRDMTTEWLPL